MKILVTGSHGLLGQKLTAQIGRSRNHELFCTGRSVNVAPACSDYRRMDITDPVQVREVIGAVRPDVIIHGAAMTQVDACEEQREACWTANVSGTENLLQASAAVGAHFIFVSTDFIFDGTKTLLSESAEPGPVNFYGKSKLAAERLVMAYPGSWAILRTVLVYGVTADTSRSNIVLWVKKSLEEGKTIRVVNDQWRTPTLAEDLAAGCLLAAERKAQGIYHISGSELMTPYDIAVAVALFFQLDDKLIEATTSKDFRQTAARPLKTGFNIEKARRELGYQPRRFEEGLRILSAQIGG